MDNVDACLSGAHPGQTGPVPVGEPLTVVIVFLFTNAEGHEGDVIVGDKVYVIECKLVVVVKLKSSARAARATACKPHCGLIIFSKFSGWLLHHSDF